MKKELIHSVRRMSIRHKLIVVLVMQFIILILWYAYMVQISVVQDRKRQQTAAQQLGSRVLSELGVDISAMYDVSTFPVLHTSESSEYIYNYLSAGSHGTVTDDDISREYQYDINVSQQISNYLGVYKAQIDQIYIFSLDGNGIGLSTRQLTYMNVKTETGASWLRRADEAYGRAVLLSQKDLDGTSVATDAGHIYTARAIINAETYKPVGVILVGCNVAQMAAKYLSASRQSLGIYSDDGRLVYGAATAGKTLLTRCQKQMAGDTVNTPRITLQTQGRFLFGVGIDPLNRFFSVIRMPATDANINFQQYGFWIMIAALFLCSMGLVTVFLHSVIRPLSSVMAACGEIASGNFHVTLPMDEAIEFQKLSGAFNRMASEIAKLIKERYLRSITERELELQMLRSQINPHFLYNTLESMRMTAYVHNEDTLAEMCLRLARILRYGVTDANEEVSVKAEVEHASDYIHLETLINRDRVEFIQNIQESIYEAETIKLVLQPLIENAIFHGAFSKEGKAQIIVLGYQQEHRLIFRVIDNGIGMEPDQVEDLNGYIQGRNDHYRSIGLKNVHRRIRLYYGEPYGLIIESRKNRGTSVTATLPLHSHKESGQVV